MSWARYFFTVSQQCNFHQGYVFIVSIGRCLPCVSLFLGKPPGVSDLFDTCNLLVFLLFDGTDNEISRVLLVLEFTIETYALFLLGFGGMSLILFFLSTANIYLSVSMPWQFSCWCHNDSSHTVYVQSYIYYKQCTILLEASEITPKHQTTPFSITYPTVKPVRAFQPIINIYIVHILIIPIYYIETAEVDFCHTLLIFTPYIYLLLEPLIFGASLVII